MLAHGSCALHWIYPQPAPAQDSLTRCWTCARTRPDSEIRACTRPHCVGRADLAREKPTETRPPQPNTPQPNTPQPNYVDPYKSGTIYWVPE